MVFIIFPNLKNNKGITLVEIIVVIFIIALFSSIIIADFPTIQKHFALSRASYQLAQDLRKIQDLGLSGVQITDMEVNPVLVQGYGIFLYPEQSDKQYVIYADIDDGLPSDSQKYSNDLSYPLCSQKISPKTDCVLNVVDVSQDDPDLYIKDINNICGVPFTSINFSPPDPDVAIDNLCSFYPYPENTEVGIVLGLHSDNSAERTVCVSTSGLISVHIHNCED
jgi:prepilin-type N-terminal cleavage/methylation domain-containing protein